MTERMGFFVLICDIKVRTVTYGIYSSEFGTYVSEPLGMRWKLRFGLERETLVKPNKVTPGRFFNHRQGERREVYSYHIYDIGHRMNYW